MHSQASLKFMLVFGLSGPVYGLDSMIALSESAARETQEWRIESRLTSRTDELAPELQSQSLSLTWWATHRRVAFGAGVGAVHYTMAEPSGAPFHSLSRPMVYTEPVLTLGWRLRVGEATLYADTSSALFAAREDLQRARLAGGTAWKASQSRLGLDRGSFAIQLDSGLRMSLRPRKGGLSLMVRGSF